MALAVGLPLPQVADALPRRGRVSRWRMELHERADGLVVVNDAYNANPASMAAAIEALVAIGGRRGRRTVAVLGEMKRARGRRAEDHREVGRARGAPRGRRGRRRGRRRPGRSPRAPRRRPGWTRCGHRHGGA